MDCLRGYIGISPQVGLVASNLYLTDLPGITMNNLAKIAEQQPEQPDFTAVFNDCEKRALLSIRGGFTSNVNKCYRITDMDVIECIVCNNKELIGAALWYLIGAEVMIERQGSDRLNRFTTIDRKKAGELQRFFEDRYSYELQNAVNSVDVNDNDCTGEPVEHSYIIHKVLPIL